MLEILQTEILRGLERYLITKKRLARACGKKGSY